MHVFGRCTSPCLCPCHGDGLDVDVRRGLVEVHVEADDVLRSPAVACPMVCVHSPVLDALLQPDIGIASLDGEIDILTAKGEMCQHVMVAADDDADGAVRAVVGIAHGIALVLVRLEAELVQTLLQTLMQRHGIGAERHHHAFIVDLKVELLAREIVVVVGVLIL